MGSIKNVCLFTGGAIVGATVCGAMIVKKVITSETLRPIITEAIAKKISDSLNEELDYRRRVEYKPYNRAKQVSYRPYYSGNMFNINEIVFETETQAKDALNDLRKIVNEYGFVTVADFCDIANVTANYVDSKFGWTMLNDVKVVEDNFGYRLDLPKAIELGVI